MAATIGFMVTGEQKIHCEGCEERIGNALRRLPGIESVQASHQSQRVAVIYDPARVKPNQIQAKLEQIGYQVHPQEGPR